MMFARRALFQSHVNRIASIRRHPAITSRDFSSTQLPNGITLAYDLHEPPKGSTAKAQDAPPIVFIHGLFGSKKNNRSMSKYAPSSDLTSRKHPLTHQAESWPVS